MATQVDVSPASHDGLFYDAVTELFLAVTMNDVEKLQDALSDGANANCTAPSGASLLHIASARGHFDVVRTLIHFGADISALWDGVTPLHVAVANGNYDVVGYLIQQGADVNQGDSRGWTSLHLAAYRTNRTMLTYLIQHGADIHCRNDNGDTPMELFNQRSIPPCARSSLETTHAATSNTVLTTPELFTEFQRFSSFHVMESGQCDVDRTEVEDWFAANEALLGVNFSRADITRQFESLPSVMENPRRTTLPFDDYCLLWLRLAAR